YPGRIRLCGGVLTIGPAVTPASLRPSRLGPAGYSTALYPDMKSTQRRADSTASPLAKSLAISRGLGSPYSAAATPHRVVECQRAEYGRMDGPAVAAGFSLHFRIVKDQSRRWNKTTVTVDTLTLGNMAS